MTSDKKQFIAATTSPRRKKLLRKIIPDISFTAPLYQEKLPRWFFCPVLLTLYFAFRKACSLKTGKTVLAFDTLVFRWFKIYGKPRNRKEALQMIQSLNGKKHYVVTGLVLKKGYWFIFRFVLSRVKFRRLTEKMIRDHISSGLWQGKAGAYGIQDKGQRLVESFQGDYHNIVGLPLEELKKVIK